MIVISLILYSYSSQEIYELGTRSIYIGMTSVQLSFWNFFFGYFVNVDFCHIPSKANGAAHNLAKFKAELHQ